MGQAPMRRNRPGRFCNGLSETVHVRSGAQPIFDLALYHCAEHEHQRPEEEASAADGETAGNARFQKSVARAVRQRDFHATGRNSKGVAGKVAARIRFG